MILKKRMNKKAAFEFDELLPWIIGIGVLVLIVSIYVILTGKAEDSINFLKDIFRFGR
jgi:hypothetical protein